MTEEEDLIERERIFHEAQAQRIKDAILAFNTVSSSVRAMGLEYNIYSDGHVLEVKFPRVAIKGTEE